MIALDTQRLFFDSPYPVTLDEGGYVVKTDHDIFSPPEFPTQSSGKAGWER